MKTAAGQLRDIRYRSETRSGTKEIHKLGHERWFDGTMDSCNKGMEKKSVRVRGHPRGFWRAFSRKAQITMVQVHHDSSRGMLFQGNVESINAGEREAKCVDPGPICADRGHRRLLAPNA